MSETTQAARAPELGLIRSVVHCYQDLTALTSQHVRSLGPVSYTHLTLPTTPYV